MLRTGVAEFGATGSQFFLENHNVGDSSEEQFTFGHPNDLPLAGRWDNTTGHDR
ncbi:MAG: hypothetical protein ACYDEO_25850 [Aggregatilineales bacterium]